MTVRRHRRCCRCHNWIRKCTSGWISVGIVDNTHKKMQNDDREGNSTVGDIPWFDLPILLVLQLLATIQSSLISRMIGKVVSLNTRLHTIQRSPGVHPNHSIAILKLLILKFLIKFLKLFSANIPMSHGSIGCFTFSIKSTDYPLPDSAQTIWETD